MMLGKIKTETKIRRMLRAIGGIDVAEMKAEVVRQKAETASLERTISALEVLQKSMPNGNGTDPTPAGPTIKERTREYVKAHPPAGPAAIAKAIGAERVQVQHVLQVGTADFRKTAEGWKLR